MNNYIVCRCSAIGKSHENEGINCQDNCYSGRKDNIYVVAIGDGVSSSKYSEIASRTAVKYIVLYCLKNIKKYDSSKRILSILRKGFEIALLKIKQIAINAPNDYDTTLTAAVVIKDNLYFGQIGDSGIIALLEDGRFERITEEQNGEGIGKDRPVYPLAVISKWSFGYKNKIKAIFLATDGVLKKLQPSILLNQKYNLNHNYLSYIFNNIFSNSDNDITAQNWLQNEIENMAPEEVDFDDKTLCVLINLKSHITMQSKEYYNFPTYELWNQLIKEHEEKLYPYRINNIKEIDVNNEKNDSNYNKENNEVSYKTSSRIKSENIIKKSNYNFIEPKNPLRKKLVNKKKFDLKEKILVVLIIIEIILVGKLCTLLFF